MKRGLNAVFFIPYSVTVSVTSNTLQINATHEDQNNTEHVSDLDTDIFNKLGDVSYVRNFSKY